ncbi:MAG: Pimeloyl-ACP methyl ester carboxylesterase [Marmoricola sp.]|nr:Pimeloyl-ACP methyl ester carboxylesterase [Marmoricola sp.]
MYVQGMTRLPSRPSELGTANDLALTGGTVRYFESGPARGPVVVFVHGLLVNADLWRGVTPGLAGRGARCLAVDWPLGSHRIPVPDADLSPTGVAALIADFLARLDLRDVTVVANDTGGALTQILITTYPERIGKVVLTPSDSFERFFPPLFGYLPLLSRIPGSLWLLGQGLRPRWAQRLPIGFGWLAKRPMPREVVDSYLLPSRTDRAIRRDLARFLPAVHRRHTLAAARKLSGFDKPVLLAWATEDRHFPISLAHRLADLLPQARIVPITDTYTFVPEDQPAVLTDLVAEFVGLPGAA